MNHRSMGFSTLGGILTIGLLSGCANLLPPAQLQVEHTKVYVANESSNSVSVIDGNTFKPLAEIDTLNHATHDLSLTRNGKQLWATNLASGRISVIDTDAMETIASIYTGNRAHVVTLTNDNRQAWVANIGNDTISIIDTKIYRILGTIPVSKGPMGIAFSKDGRLAYVSSQDKMVNVIDTAAHQVIKRIPVGANPHFLVVGPNGRIWGTNTGSQDLYIIDTNTNEVVQTLEVGPAPQQIAFAFKGTAGPNAYVTVAGLNKVIMVSANTEVPTIRGQIDVGEGPNGIWANSVGTRLYVGHTRSNDVRILDTGTNQVLATVPVGRKPIRVVASK
jgi:YVTN family beta-propeller protein